MAKTHDEYTEPHGSDAKPNRNQRRRAQTRAFILEAADRVFRRKGVNGTTVNDVTEEADVAYGSFYNHFKNIDDVVAAVAENTIKNVADETGAMFSHAARVEILPIIGARVLMRLLSQDPATRWLLERPYIFVAEFYKMARPFMFKAEREAVAAGVFKPVGGHETWLRLFPWLIICELNEALDEEDLAAAEDRFARISIRLLGVDDNLVDELVKESRTLFDETDLTSSISRKPRKKREAKAKSIASSSTNEQPSMVRSRKSKDKTLI